MKCINCGKANADVEHITRGLVCQSCIPYFNTCTNCGKLFDKDDFEMGVQDSRFCKSCEELMDK